MSSSDFAQVPIRRVQAAVRLHPEELLRSCSRWEGRGQQLRLCQPWVFARAACSGLWGSVCPEPFVGSVLGELLPEV